MICDQDPLRRRPGTSSSTMSIRRLGSPTSSTASPGRRRASSTNSSRGTGKTASGTIRPHRPRPPPGASSPEMRRHQTQPQIPSGLRRMLTVDPKLGLLSSRPFDTAWPRGHSGTSGSLTGPQRIQISRPHTRVDHVLTVHISTHSSESKALENNSVFKGLIWLRGLDLNQRPSGYEPDELPDCSTPRNWHPALAGLAATYSSTP